MHWLWWPGFVSEPGGGEAVRAFAVDGQKNACEREMASSRDVCRPGQRESVSGTRRHRFLGCLEKGQMMPM